MTWARIGIVMTMVAADPIFAGVYEEAGYQVRHWGVAEGLPSSEVNAVLQTSDGYVWASAGHSLIRFDGATMKVFRTGGKEGLPDFAVVRLFEDSTGRLIIVHTRSRPMTVFKNGRFESLNAVVRRPGNDELVECDPSGTLLKIRRVDGTVYRLRDNEFQVHTRFDPAPVGTLNAFGAQDGEIWLNGGRRLFRLTSEGAVVQPEFGKRPGEGQLCSKFFSHSDKSLMFVANDGVYRIQGTNFVRETNAVYSTQALEGVDSNRVCMDRLGNIWGGWHFDRPVLTTLFKDGRVARAPAARGGSLLAVTPDAEGGIWVGSMDGLRQFVPIGFQTPDAMTTLPNRRINALRPDSEGGLWMISDYYLSHFSHSANEFKNFKLDDSVVHLAVGQDRSVWVADWESNLLRLSRAGQDLDSVSVPTRDHQYNQRIFESKDGTLWVASATGLWYRRGADLTQDGLPPTLMKAHATGFAEDDRGRLYVCLNGGGFAILEGGVWREEVLPDSAADYFPLGIVCSEDGRCWWLGVDRSSTEQRTALGIRSDNQWSLLENDALGLKCQAIGFVADGWDGLWIATPECGLFRYSRNNLIDYAAGKKTQVGHEQFTSADGMPSVTSSGYLSKGLCRTEDGNIWIATVAGPTMMNPERLASMRGLRSQPRARIEEAVFDDVTQSPSIEGLETDDDGIPQLVIPPEATRIEIRYTGIHLPTPSRVRFRYRLEDYDSGWIEVGDRRVAYYQNIPPGDYRFKVTASLEGGAWYNNVASLNVLVLPAWWQTGLFRSGVAIAVMIVIMGTYAAMVRSYKREQIRQQDWSHRLIRAQEEERQRIAVELHDGLGQNLTIIKNRLTLEGNKLADSSDTPADLQSISDVVSLAIQDVRSISHNLRPIVLDHLGLTKAIDKIVKRTAEATRLPVNCKLDNIDGILEPENEINLYRIIQEGLNNVVKHADAASIALTVERNSQMLRVKIEDDGRGFERNPQSQSAMTTGGMGLIGIQERARIMGGIFECRSARRNGTILNIEIPIKAEDEKRDTHYDR